MNWGRREFSVCLAALLLTGGRAQAQIADETIRQATVGIMDAGNAAFEIAALRRVPRVTVIDLRLLGLGVMRKVRLNLAEFEISAQKNAVGVNRLRKALKANPATRAALAKTGVKVNRILAVHIFSNGSLRVFIL
ncbi:MAG: hypothetical protein ACT4SY_00870 [Hyphomicrobiales bacterium]